MAITTLNLRGLNRSDTATSGQVITATSAVAADFQDAAGGGKILQIVQNQWKTSQTTTATLGSFTILTDSVTAINPASTSNSILIMVNVAISGSAYHSFYKLQHNGSGSYVDVAGSLGTGASGSRTNITSRSGMGGDATNTGSSTFCYIDAPSKDSSFNYQLVYNSRAAGSAITNTSSEQTDIAHIGWQGSTITLFELDGDGS